MLDAKNDSPPSSATTRRNDAPIADGGSLGLKGFNQVGREDSDNEVLKQQVDPAHRRRAAALIAVVLLLICVVSALAFQRSGLSFIPKADEEQHQFGPPPAGSPD
jgi:multidrug efflux pump subunit AcrB